MIENIGKKMSLRVTATTNRKLLNFVIKHEGKPFFTDVWSQVKLPISNIVVDEVYGNIFPGILKNITENYHD